MELEDEVCKSVRDHYFTVLILGVHECAFVHIHTYIYVRINPYIYIYSRYRVEQQETKSGPGIGHALSCPFW